MLTVLVILAVAGILFGAAALATHDGPVLRDPLPDDRGAALPATALQPEDVAELRFDMALRGYRMAEVDAALARLADELSDRDRRISELEHALASAPVPPEPEPEPAPAVEEEAAPAAVEAFEPLEPPSAAPAAISGPLTATTWFTEPAPEHVHDLSHDAAHDPLASAQVDEPAAADERTQEEAEALEAPPEPVASAQVDEPAAADERTQAEPEALTLTAADDAFSFPELLPAEPAGAEPVAAEPAGAEPVAAEPVAAEPVAAEEPQEPQEPEEPEAERVDHPSGEQPPGA